MTEPADAARELAVANRILAHQGVLEEFGHVSIRHPVDPQRFLIARAMSANTVTPTDIISCGLNGEPVADGRHPPRERFIHAAIYEARPDIRAVIHAHCEHVLPFGVTGASFAPVVGPVGDMGCEVPVWDIADGFGDSTDLLVSDLARGRDLARRLGPNRAVLMRGHGFVTAGRTLNDVVRRTVYVPRNGRTIAAASPMGAIKRLSAGEAAARLAIDPESPAMRRGWEYWAKQAGCEFLPD
jgi:ribulose-5-phosphate 4-epimerase/fuculose-1-phosphate aldolase